jgi:hypothetical protein
MALARCALHPPTAQKKSYVQAVAAAGKGLVCGSAGCFNDAQVWLTSAELLDYQNGETVFSPDSATAKFRVVRAVINR